MAKTPKGPSIREFQKRFPDEETCLAHLMRVRYGERLTCIKCLKNARYYRVKKRRSFECEHCGYQVYPTAGTPFESTRTSLRDWFYVMYLFCASRNGVAAKEVQRQLGVTYKTAWRMCRLIREYMGYVDGDSQMGGSGGGMVEVDETFIGGHDRLGEDDKAIVLGMTERGGETLTRVIHNRFAETILPHVVKWVRAGARVSTDEFSSYRPLVERFGYRHETVNHDAKEYVRGDVHTNTIEAFWAHVKRSISGTYIAVSKKHLQKYLWEFEFRQNLRHVPYLMFEVLMQAFSKVQLAPPSSAGDGQSVA